MRNVDKSVIRRMLSGVAWTALGSASTQGATFVASIIVARALGREAFGQYAMIMSTVYALTGLSGLGLGVTAIKYVSQYRNVLPEKAGRVLGLSSGIAVAAGIGFSVALLILAPSLATDSSLVPGLRVSAAFVFFTTLNGYQIGALVGFEAFGRIARIGLVTGPTAVLAVWISSRASGLMGAVIAQGTVALAIWLLHQIALSSELQKAGISIRYRDAWSERAALVRFAAPAILSGLTGSVAIWWCNNALVRNCGYAELAIFSAATNLRLMVLFVPSLVARVAAPLLNNLLANGELSKFRRAFWGAVASNGIIGLALAAILFVTGSSILRLFGKEFVSAPRLLFLLLLSAVVEVVACNLYQAVFTAKTLWWQVVVQSAWTVLLLFLSHELLPSGGAVGLAQAYLAAWCVSLGLYAMLAHSKEGLANERGALLFDSNSGV
jgi:O-antigen/teichoic acid export membrane protein